VTQYLFNNSILIIEKSILKQMVIETTRFFRHFAKRFSKINSSHLAESENLHIYSQ